MTVPVSDLGALVIIAITALFTLLTRAIPFLFFGGQKGAPAWIIFLGRVLPPAIIAILVVYCLRGVMLTAAPFGLPEIIAVLTAAGLQKYKHNNLLSILCSTALYCLLIRI